MKIIENSKNKIVFSEEVEESLANAIRRSVNEIPILAIDEVEFYKNDSVLYDEIISHRLGLTPFVTEKTLNLQEKCTCKEKGCSKCSVQLKIQAKGPCTVYSKDLKGKAKVVYNDMPIVLLKAGQELEFVAKAKLGKGIEHTKFSPGLTYYRNLAEINFGKDCDMCKECIKSCPQKILKAGKSIVAEDIYKCDMCEACVEACKKHGKEAIKIKPSEELIFYIESWGQIEAKDIFGNAIKALRENLKELEK